MTATSSRAGRRAGLLLPLLALALGLAACGGGDSARPGGGSGSAGPPPALRVSPPEGATGVGLDVPVTVTAESGTLDSVTVRAASGASVPGAAAADRSSWRSSAPLDPATSYTVDVQATGQGGPATLRSSFTTILHPVRLITTVSPDDGATVGVGMPVSLRFSSPVASQEQANLVQHIQVQTSAPLVGAWHWFSSREVHWRPRELWPAHTRVTVSAHLRGVPAGNGVWGLGDWSSSFAVGDRHVSTVDLASHQMTVYDGDALVHTYPISGGRPQNPTLGGTLVVLYKQQKVHMTSASIGIPTTSPDGYDEDVFWDTAISTDGYFIHAAPWSVAQQGSANVSHGCVNLSDQRAQEFYQFSNVGDVVRVLNSSRPADQSDGEGDWQIPFDQYANSGHVGTAAPPTANPGGL